MLQACIALVAGADSPSASQPASAPAEEPWVESVPADMPRTFALNIADLHLGMESEYERRTMTTSLPRKRDTRFESRDFRLRELLGTTVSGHVYDPNLLEYRAMLELGLEQNRFDQDNDGIEDNEHHSGFLHEYDVSLDAMKTKPVSFHAYARRSDNRLPRAFLLSLHEIDTEYGVSSLINAGPTVTEIGLSWREADRRGNHDPLDDEKLTTGRFYIDHTWTISDEQKLRVQYDHEREESKYQGSRYHFDTHRDEVRVEHEAAFGAAKQHRLDTFFLYSAEQGDLAIDELELVPRLTLTHNDQFQTIHRYGFYRYLQDAIETAQHKFDTQAIYKPRDDLRITTDAFGLYEKADEDVQTTEFGGGFDVNYNRPTSLGGLNVNLASAYQRTDLTGDAGRRFVHDEARVLGGSHPVYLKELGIIAASIIAHDERRTRYYLAGVDYTVTPIGKRMRVDRIMTGRIAETDAVYFDYQYVLPAHGSINEFRNDFLIEHAFTFGLTPYYGYEGRCEEVESSTATPWARDDIHRHRLGVRYERDRWSAGTEYEIYDATWEPYTAWHTTGRAAVFRSAAHSLDLWGELSRYLYDSQEDDRDVWWLDVSLKDNYRFNDWLSFNGGLRYHWEDDSCDGTTHGVDAQWGLQLVRGYLTVELTIEYDLLSIAGNRENGFEMFLNVRRNLTHLLPEQEGKP